MKKIIVAIDGYSSCGKSTVAKELAKFAGYIYIDTGAMYRSVALYALKNGWVTEQSVDTESLEKNIKNLKIGFQPNKNGMQDTFLNDENVEKEIRTLEISNVASRISTLAFVREELVRQQQLMGKEKGIVMDGRDIGTVVFPSAELKLFLTASAEIRAKRRFDEMIEKGENPNYDEVLANVKERDLRDTTRKESPLKQAEDAIVVDNSELSREEQREIIKKLFQEKTKSL